MVKPDTGRLGASLGRGWSSQVWPVYKHYYLEDDVIKERRDQAEKRTYFPVGSPELFTDFVNLGKSLPEKAYLLETELVQSMRISHKEAVLSFARQWGLLGYDSLVDKPQRRGGDPLDFVLLQIVRVKVVCQWFDDIKSGRQPSDTESYYKGKAAVGDIMRHILGFVNSGLKGLEIGIRPFFTGYESFLELDFMPATEEDYGLPSSSLDFAPGMEFIGPIPQGFRVELKYRALLNIIYWHLANYVARERDWGRCLECGSFFERTDPRQQFCPPNKYGKRPQSQCAVRHRVRKARGKKQLNSD